MPTISFSQGWINAFIPKVVGISSAHTGSFNTTIDAKQSYNPLLGRFAFGGSIPPSSTILIMKGTQPVDFTGLTTLSVRQSDILIRFSTLNSLSMWSTSVESNPVVINSEYATAEIDGTATWFWWVVQSNSLNMSTMLTGEIWHQIIGSVGVSGSSSELEMGDTNVVTGNSYRITNLRLQIPTTWTYT